MTAAITDPSFHENFVTSKERDAFMFNKEFMSDCAFVVEDGENTIKNSLSQIHFRMLQLGIL